MSVAAPSAFENAARYVSTRGGAEGVPFDRVLLEGLAPDGGLYIPQAWPRWSAADHAAAAWTPYATLSKRVLRDFVGAALPAAATDDAAQQGADVFTHPAVTPLVQIAPNLWLLELFHGPTMAFKDCAMQVMGRLVSAALAQSGERLLILTATSGDTGAAAVNAFAGRAHVDMVVLHPKGRVSPVQRKQMTTVDAPNVLNLAVRGDFDDCQRLVKTLLGDLRLRNDRRVSSVNSINWGRLAGQATYYIAAAAALGGRARFVVPTGNFGDAFAGWVAKQTGAGVEHLTAAVNQNDALARALNDGVYERRAANPSASVSMDVQAPSNFERLVFEAAGRDPATVRDVFDTFARDGEVALGPALTGPLREAVSAVSISEAETAAEIQRVHAETGGYFICPHTAVGVAAARRLPTEGAPIVVLATAHAAKFPDSVAAAIGTPPPVPPAIAALDDKSERAVEVAADADAVRAAMADRFAAV